MDAITKEQQRLPLMGIPIGVFIERRDARMSARRCQFFRHTRDQIPFDNFASPHNLDS